MSQPRKAMKIVVESVILCSVIALSYIPVFANNMAAVGALYVELLWVVSASHPCHIVTGGRIA
jgi:hypothetical protein